MFELLDIHMPHRQRVDLERNLSKIANRGAQRTDIRLAEARKWFARQIGVYWTDVDAVLSKTFGDQRDEHRDVHFHNSTSWTAAVCSKTQIFGGTIILEGLDRNKNNAFYSYEEIVARAHLGLPSKPDVETFVEFSEHSRFPQLRDLPINEGVTLHQPINGQMAAIDAAHSAPAMPAGIYRLLLAYGGD